MKKKFLSVLLLCILTALTLFLIKSYYIKDYGDKGLKIKNEDLNLKVMYKGLNNAMDFAVDDLGNYYIAYKNRIQIIKNGGQSYDLLSDSNLNIYSIEYYNENIYFTSGTNVYCLNLKDNKVDNIIKDLPNYGDYRDSMLRVKGDYLYVTIGSATNSGVVGEDNSWIKDTPYIHDVTPKDITIKGINFGKEKTGAFQSFKTKSLKGQIIPEHFPGNASVIIYNLKTGNSETFAWGIRNITGMDFNNEGKLIASIGGMEDRGVRPIQGDSDYIYEIKKGTWYGWPDYSGGDPVSSPRFKSNKYGVIQFILENHPTTNPPAPLYQHKSVCSVGSLAVDSNNSIGEKNCIYFYDKLDNVLYGFSGAGAIKEEAKFNPNTKISSIKFNGKSLLVLDQKSGNLFNIEKISTDKGINITKSIYIYFLLVILFGIVVGLTKFQKNSQ